MIANKLDGAGSSYYTMGDRKYPELRTYFGNILATMSSVAALANKRTVIVQLVAFSEPEWQLPRYLETMEEAGLKELKLSVLKHELFVPDADERHPEHVQVHELARDSARRP